MMLSRPRAQDLFFPARFMGPSITAATCIAIAITLATYGDDAKAMGDCPSFTPGHPEAADHECLFQPVSGQNPDLQEWKELFFKASRGKEGWGTGGVDLGPITKGCTSPQKVDATVPCAVLMAKVQLESGWKQFCEPTDPSDAVGKGSRTLVSWDCGYGASQVTSGMTARIPAEGKFDGQRVAAEPLYNLSAGVQNLVGKWNATGCVGERNPAVIENWYSALWAYNSMSYRNNPNNPNLKANRGIFDPMNGDSSNDWTYTERIFGLIENPPNEKWKPVQLAYPNRGNISDPKISEVAALDTTPKTINIYEPYCASPTDCTNLRGVHTSVNCDEIVAGDPPTTPPKPTIRSNPTNTPYTSGTTNDASTQQGQDGGSVNVTPVENRDQENSGGCTFASESPTAHADRALKSASIGEKIGDLWIYLALLFLALWRSERKKELS